jgi:hypothetical protein
MPTKLRQLTIILAILTATLQAGTRQPGYPFPHVQGPTVPQSVAPGGPNFTLTVYGANFIPASVVNWNRQPRTTTYISAHELQATILATDIAAPTAAMITVTTTSPNGPITSSTFFQVEVHDANPTMGTTTEVTYTKLDAFFNGIADLTNDSSVDLIGTVGSNPAGSNIVGSLINNGKGVFRPGGPMAFNQLPENSVTTNILGDFNGDGNQDLLYVVGNVFQSSPAKLGISFGNGNGTFTPGPLFGSFGLLGPEAPDLAVGDFNQDGTLDIAASPGGKIEMFLGNGDGTFTLGKPSPGGSCGGFALADFNGDGKLDILCSGVNLSDTDFTLQVMFGNGDGTFQVPKTIVTNSTSGLFATTYLVNDFNNDGSPDVAYTTDAGQIAIILNNGDGTFQPPVYYAVGQPNLFSFALGDFNNDGNTDIIVAQFDVNQDFSILLGNGDGTFQEPQVLSTTIPYSNGITVADFNNDGLLDFAIPEYYDYLYFQQ